MSFASFEFIIFIGIFAAIWPFIRKQSMPRWIGITIASFVFYGWWDWRFLFLLIGTGLIDFLAALAMERFPNRRTPALWFSLCTNIGCLVFLNISDLQVMNCVSFLDYQRRNGLGPTRSSYPLASAFTHSNQ